MFNKWWVWSLRHWSMVYTTVTAQIFYLYSEINIFIIRYTILLWIKKLLNKCQFINGSILVFLWIFSSNISLTIIGQHGAQIKSNAGPWGGGKPEHPAKTSRRRAQNQQTQPTYDAGSGNRTRATLVGGISPKSLMW